MFIKAIKRYIFMYKAFAKNSIAAQMEYRINFILAISVECAFLFVKMLYVFVAYKVNMHVNGLSPDSIMLFVGTYTTMTALMNAFFFNNVASIPEYVRSGSLDLMITKPVSLQFMVTLRKFDIGLAIPNLAGGIGMTVIAWRKLGISVTVFNLGIYLVMLVASLILTYAVVLFPYIFSFWIVKADAISDVTFALWDFNNMPMGIYNKWIRNIGIYIIPVFVISNFPVMFLLGQLKGIYIFWSIVCPVLFFVLVKLFWDMAVRNYTSASS
jgi:ABC-2 type transport system permease protein